MTALMPNSSRTTSNSGVILNPKADGGVGVDRRSVVEFEHYRLAYLLGRGGMAEVFLAAWSPATNVVRPRVIKRLYAHLSDDEQLVRMFLDEARLVCELEHENIVKTFEVGLIDEQFCIAMEYLEGQPLNRVLRRVAEVGGLPTEACVYIARAVLAALEHAHTAADQFGRAREVVHRDISPHNVFVTNHGQVKVLDFGIAKAKSHEARTSTGVVKGKFAYIAPEQAKGKRVDARADLFSLGVVLWEMLTSRRLFKADDDASTLNATLHREIPRLTQVRPDISVELSRIVSRALQRDVALRYASASDMLRDLDHFVLRAGLVCDAASLSGLMHRSFESEIALQERLVRELTHVQAVELPAAAPPPVEGTLAVATYTKAESDAETRVLLAKLRSGRRVAWGAILAITLVLGAFTGYSWFSRNESAAPSAEDTAYSEKSHLGKETSASSAPEAKLVASASASAKQTSEGVDRAKPADVSVSPKRGRSEGAPARGWGTVQARALSPSALPPKVDKPASVEGRAVETGYLTIDSTPWANVSLRGQSLGQTPIIRLSLPAGTHVLSLRNPELGLETTYTVNVLANQTVVRRIGLR
ncbi:MAG: serine/threonine-protein kinase [Polyangiaceae bacterium]